MAATDQPQLPRKRRSRWWRAVAALALFLAAGASLFAALPWILSWPFAQRAIQARANAIMAPSSVEFSAVRLSWFQPTRIDGLALLDKDRNRVVASDHADLDWDLAHIVFHWPRRATLDLHDARLKIRRAPDGAVNLYEALRPIIKERPRHQVVIKVERGRLSFLDEALPGPIEAGRADVLLNMDAWPEPASWQLGLDEISLGTERGRFDFKGRYIRVKDRLEIGELRVATRFGQIDAAGTLDAAKTAPVANFEGTIAPDWEELNRILTESVEPNARIVGRASRWAVAGPLTGGPKEGRFGRLKGRAAVHLDALDVFGLRLETTDLVLRADEGNFSFDPMETRLNQGELHLEPRIDRDDDGTLRVAFGETSWLKDAIVNDEVSHRVLSYVAPVLDGATRVQGRVSLRRMNADFPIVRQAPSTHARVEGDIVFDDVRFLPGPLAAELIGLLPGSDVGRPLIALRDPINFRIADGKIHQSGLRAPIGKIAALEMAGTVDFQKNLDLLASFHLNDARRELPLLSPLLRAARLDIPVRGTLDQPKIDGEAMKQRYANIGSELLDETLGPGAGDLLKLFKAFPKPRPRPGKDDAKRGPAGANANANADAQADENADNDGPFRLRTPLTPEERRARRQERRMERLEKQARRRAERQRKRQSD